MPRLEILKKLRQRADFKFHLLQHMVAWAVLILALFVNYWTGEYVDKFVHNLPPAHDLLFEYLPSFDLSLLHFWGFVLFLLLAFIGAPYYEGWQNLPYLAWTFAVLIIVRAIFTTLTPLGLPHEAPSFKDHQIYTHFMKHFDFRGALFFSGHTSFPFLGYLIFRKPWMKRASLLLSVVLALEVLISRLHYSIDVAAAFFITYGVYRLVGYIFFRVEYRLLKYAYKGSS